MGYNFMVLISEKSDITTETLAEKIKHFKILDLKTTDSDIQVVFNLYDHNVSFKFLLETENRVLFESKEIADKWAKNHIDKDIIASCNRRFSMYSWGDTIEDFDFCMNLLDTIQKINGVYIFDPVNGSFWGQ